MIKYNYNYIYLYLLLNRILNIKLSYEIYLL